MKILVTGGAGFIGSHLADRLIEEGHDVVIIDNLSTGKKENINKNAKFYNISIEDPQLSEIFEKEKPDYVNHHAAQIDLRLSIKDPIFDAKSNVIGLLNVLQNCVKYKVKKIIFISSGGAIYGAPKTLPAKEDFPKFPLSPYGVSKCTGELYLNFYSKVFGLNYTSLRYANVYGPRQQGGEAGVVSIFINNILSGREPVIFGDGKQTRDYVYVKDVVDANILALTKGDNSGFNIGTGIPTSVNKLFSLIKGIACFEGEAKHVSPIAGELKEIYLNCDKARELLGWQPAITLKKGLEETYCYFKNKQKT